MTRVSIVIPCFNHARFLADALDSVRAQTWPLVEAIVVDDGSTDDPSSIASRYPDVRVIRQSNRGLSAARNSGWQASSGDIIIFLDADDVLYPTAAAAAVEQLATHPETMMTFAIGSSLRSEASVARPSSGSFGRGGSPRSSSVTDGRLDVKALTVPGWSSAMTTS